MKNLTFSLLTFLFSFYCFKSNSQTITISERLFQLSNFVIENHDSILYKKDSIIYKLWYPEEGVLVLVSKILDSTTFLIDIKNYNLYEEKVDSILVKLNKINRFNLNKTRLAKVFLENELYFFSHKERDFKSYDFILNSRFWKDSKLEIVPDWTKSCRGYPFKIVNSNPTPNKLMRAILVEFDGI